MRGLAGSMIGLRREGRPSRKRCVCLWPRIMLALTENQLQFDRYAKAYQAEQSKSSPGEGNGTRDIISYVSYVLMLL